jgi:hypothetical protein
MEVTSSIFNGFGYVLPLYKGYCSDDFYPRAPADMIHTSAKTQMALKKDYDEFGDSYTQDTSPEQLEYTFKHMQNVSLLYSEHLSRTT